MTFKLKIVKRKNKYAILLASEGKKDEPIATVNNQEDAMLLSYFIDRAKKGLFEEEDFQNYILDNNDKFPFLTIPEE